MTVLVFLVLSQQASLVVTNRQLSQRLRSVTNANLGLVEAGTQLGLLSGIGVHGSRQTYALHESPTPSFVIGISATCAVCRANTSAWRRLAAAAASLGIELIFVSRDTPESTGAFLAEHQLQGHEVVLADPTYETYRQVGLAAVPQMALVAETGVVRQVWRGELDQDAESSIVAAFRDVLRVGRR
jgi:hypothetical protein